MYILEILSERTPDSVCLPIIQCKARGVYDERIGCADCTTDFDLHPVPYMKISRLHEGLGIFKYFVSKLKSYDASDS
jgi:hypothetical protein